MRRRELLALLSGSAATLLASCAAPPQAPPTPIALPPAPAPTPPPPPTRAPVAPPTAIPTAIPTVVPTALPTVAPTAVPTLATPPALAAAVKAAMERGVERGAFPGGVVLVRHRGKVILHAAYGHSLKYRSATDLAPTPTPARPDTIYDLASISKLFTATCVMRLVEDGRLRLDDPVARTLPEFGANGKGAITIRQLLTHTSGLPAYLKLWEAEPTPAARLRRALEVAPTNPPDTLYRYSDLGLIALGHLIEQVAGMSLDRVVATFVTGPLRLEHTHYRPPADLKPRIAPTEDESAVGRGMVWGEVHDENTWSLGGVAGHAGLFGTAEELGVFAQAYLDGGSYNGTRLLRPESIAEMTRNQVGKLEWQGLGWELNTDFYMGRLSAPDTYGHTGYTGTSLVVDPRRQLVVVLLTNRVHPSREGPSINPERQAVAAAALAAAEGA